MMMQRNPQVSESIPFDAVRTSSTPVAAPPVARRPNRPPAADAYEREDQLLAGLLMGSPEFQRR